MVPTPSVFATSGMSMSLPLNLNEEVREATRSCGSLVSRLRISSAMPSEKYSFSGSPDMLTNGSTATARRSSVASLVMFSAGAASVRAAAGSWPASGVRWMPAGSTSNTHASATASTNPSATRTVTSVTLQSGTLRLGSTVEAISITAQPATR